MRSLVRRSGSCEAVSFFCVDLRAVEDLRVED